MLDEHQQPAWFSAQRRNIEAWYLASSSPYRQSGWGSTPERWRCGREPILDAVCKSGTFLDLGCANGLLLECLMQWASERGFDLTPYGIDISPSLIELARARLPAFSDNLMVANAFNFSPPIQYDYVHTLLEYVPDELQRSYLGRLINQVVASAGRLIVSSYGSRTQGQQALDVTTYLQQQGYQVAGSAKACEVDDWVLTHVAWVEKVKSDSTLVSIKESG